MKLAFKLFQKPLKIILFIIATLASVLIIYSFVLWTLTPVYKSVASSKFNGDKWYNPYLHLDSIKWYKANFHSHSNSWGLITNGSKNTDKQIYDTYHKLGYEYIAISNYESLNFTHDSNFVNVPAYEHGYNITKTHQLLIGSQAVSYLDYPLFQTTNQKQNIINRLRQDNSIIALAHPQWGGYTKSDMKKLVGYDLIEVLNNYSISENYWDIALSNGRPAFLLANDDSHNVFDLSNVSRKVTMVPVSKSNYSFLLNVLASGSTYGIALCWESAYLPLDKKRDLVDNYPQPLSITEKNDTINIIFGVDISKIEFIGDNGNILKSVNDVKKSYLKIEDSISYVRIRATLADGTFYVFNPLIRSMDGLKPIMPSPIIDKKASQNKRIIIIVGLIIVYILFKRRKFITRLYKNEKHS